MGIFHMPIFANGHIFFEMGIFTEYAQKKTYAAISWRPGWTPETQPNGATSIYLKKSDPPSAVKRVHLPKAELKTIIQLTGVIHGLPG